MIWRAPAWSDPSVMVDDCARCGRALALPSNFTLTFTLTLTLTFTFTFTAS